MGKNLNQFQGGQKPLLRLTKIGFQISKNPFLKSAKSVLGLTETDFDIGKNRFFVLIEIS